MEYRVYKNRTLLIPEINIADTESSVSAMSAAPITFLTVVVS